MARKVLPFSCNFILTLLVAPAMQGDMTRAGKESTFADGCNNFNSLDRIFETAGTKGSLIWNNLVSAVMPWHQQHGYLYRERCYAQGFGNP